MATFNSDKSAAESGGNVRDDGAFESVNTRNRWPKQRQAVEQADSEDEKARWRRKMAQELLQTGIPSDDVSNLSEQPTESAERDSRQGRQQRSEAQDGSTSYLSAEFRRRIRPVLNRIDQLRAHGLQKSLPLPMVAVVGDQSVGKSSVLEAISGIELPRGTGIVTRCPLQLAMRSAAPNERWKGRISYTTADGDEVDKELNGPSEVGPAVRAAQDAMTEGPGDITDKQIHLSIESESVPDLTLLDLPGIARYSSTSGASIAEQTKRLISDYVDNQQVIILVVVPCHVDVETVEALSLAKKADEKGERTIGVMTCPDMVNRGAELDTLAIAMNSKIKLEKGYIMVKCRTPKELQENLTLAECIRNEREFFRTHEYFSQLPMESRGIPNLATKLVEELFQLVKKNMPLLQEEIKKLMKYYKMELQQLEPVACDTNDEKQALLTEMITKFSQQLTKYTMGESDDKCQLLADCRTHCKNLHEEIKKAKPEWLNRTNSEWEAPSHLTDIVSRRRGRQLAGYEDIFTIIESIYRREFLKKLHQPAEETLDLITEEVTKAVEKAADASFRNFYELKHCLRAHTDQEVTKLQDEARADLKRLFRQEKRVFTQDEIFLQEMEKMHENSSQDQEQQEQQQSPAPDNMERIRRGVQAYLRIASERLADTIPQSILYFMLKLIAKRIAIRTTELLRQGSLLPLVKEEEEKAARRRELKSQLEQLTQAARDFSTF